MCKSVVHTSTHMDGKSLSDARVLNLLSPSSLALLSHAPYPNSLAPPAHSLRLQFTRAVEAKQVAEQDAERAKFVVMKAEQVRGREGAAERGRGSRRRGDATARVTGVADVRRRTCLVQYAAYGTAVCCLGRTVVCIGSCV